MNYCKISNTPFEKVFDTPIMLIMIALTWQINENKKEEQKLKQWRLNH